MGDVPGELVTPRIDNRGYRSVILPNELRVLLVSDPETDKAAAAMDVNVGSYSDPDELPGLAHFLEHMLFFSSKKYPIEDDYSKFLNEHGGSSNACTANEYTFYYFDVNAEHLVLALDRFAQFFIFPLMSQDATSREIRAVDSENSKNLTVDKWKLDQLSRHLSSVNHPYHKFGTGNLDTLEVIPAAKGIDTREELIKFYNRHYSSNIMCLAVYGKESLDDLERMVKDKFSAVKNIHIKPSRFLEQPCFPEHLQILVKAVPVKERHNLELLWPIISELKNYKSAPCRYIGHILGHECDGSLFALLKSLGWANSLSAGEVERSTDISFFAINIELTNSGQQHMDEIVGLIFHYIDLLREEGVAEWTFNEIRTICEMKFHYQDKSSPSGYVSRLVSNMQHYPVEEWLIGSSVPQTFSAMAIREELNLLTPARLRIIWSSKDFEGKTSETEPWYGTAYSVEVLPEETIQRWKAKTVDKKLHLPAKNPFIATDFSLRDSDYKMASPYLLSMSKMFKVWFKPDQKFKTPKGIVIMNISCPELTFSPEASALSSLYVKLLVDYLNEYAYFAEIAGLWYNIQKTSSGFQVSLAGYNHKLSHLLDRIVEKMANFDVVEDRFLVLKEKQLKDYANFRFQQPYQQATYYASLMLEQRRWHINDLAEVLPTLEAADLRAFLPRLLSRVSIECYVAGNMSAKEAQGLADKTEKVLSGGTIVKTRPLRPSEIIEERISQLKAGSDYYYQIAGLNTADENSALFVYLQVEQDTTELNVLLELFVLSAKQQMYYHLRTVDQLGYIVALRLRNDIGVYGAQFIIQSTVKDPEAIDARLEKFLEAFETYLKELTDEEFKRNVAALAEIKLEKHKNLWEEANFYWKEIDHGACKFDRQQVEVEALNGLTKDQLVHFFQQYIRPGGPLRRKLSVQVFGKLHMKEFEAAKEQSNEKIIKDLFAFKRAQALYPSPKQ